MHCADVESWGRKVITKFKKNEILFYLSYIILYISLIIGDVYNIGSMDILARYLRIGSYILIFISCINIRLNKKDFFQMVKIINRMASTTFAILLIHDSNYFRNLIWNYILRSPIGQHLWRSKIEFIFIYFIIVIGLSGFCCLIDLIRQNTIDKLVMNSHVFTTLCEKTNMNGNAE